MIPYYLLRCSVLVILGLLIYGQTFHFGFVFDDQYFIVNNPFIRCFSQIHLMWQAFPITRLVGIYSFALNYYFGQLAPQGYHIFNFIVHLAATALVWALAELLFRINGTCPQLFRLQWGKAGPHAGHSQELGIHKDLPFIIAVLFLVHPCQTQAVTYITQRFESMATVFYLGTVYCYLQARISTDRIRKIILFGLAGCSFVLGILTKEVIITVPAMILAAEWILFPQKNNKKLYIALIVAGALLVLVLIKMLHAAWGTLFQTFHSESHDGDLLTPAHYFLTQMRVFLTFLRLFVLPIHQNLDYDYPASSGLLQPPLTLLGLGVIVGFIFLIIKLRRKMPLIAFGLSWILVTFSINLAPRSNVIFEHKMYLISFGFFLTTAAVLSILIRNQKVLGLILLAIIAVLSVLCFQRNKVWENESRLWSETVNESPYKARPLNNLGLAYFHQGSFSQAMADYNNALAINPQYSEAYNNRGLLYFRQGNFTQAILDFNQAIEKNTDYAATYSNYSNRGLAYFHQGNFIQALADYNKAIKLNPYFAEVYSNRGLLYYNQGNFTQAIADYNKAIEFNPKDSNEYNNRGTCYARLGNINQARKDYSKAVENDPNNAEAIKNRTLLNIVILSEAKNLKIP